MGSVTCTRAVMHDLWPASVRYAACQKQMVQDTKESAIKHTFSFLLSLYTGTI